VNKNNQKLVKGQSLFPRVQEGSSLIEVLVTLVIMAVGLLGLASMQMISIKNLNNSQFRSLATIYAYDMAERMRANRIGVELNSYDDLDTIGATDPNCTSCSTSEIAQLDEFQWAERITQDVISGGLPAGNGTVKVNSGVYDIKIQWQEQQRDSNGGVVETTEFTLTVQL